MKIQSVNITKFKRFTDLKIEGLSESIKLVMLVGPNGSGKTSLFEAFNHWQKVKGYNNYGDRDFYFKKSEHSSEGFEWLRNCVTITVYNHQFSDRESAKGCFYFRTAHRNEPDFTTTTLQRQESLKNQIRFDNLMSTDASVSSNYQRLVSTTLKSVFDINNNDKTVLALREELIGKIKTSLHNVFDDLILSSIGDPLQNGSFYFTKGTSEDFHYRNLSAGEKSAFDLILDLIISGSTLDDSVFCIDEPEAHMHTALQSKLLTEMYSLVPASSQLWISTHSMGMLKAAKELEDANPGTVAFIDFSDKDFDSPVVIHPSTITSTIWHKFLDFAIGDLANLIAPTRVVFCEGTSMGRSIKNFDAVVYKKIFSGKYSDTEFSSVGSCSEIENPDNISMQIVTNLLKHSQIIKFVDRDDKSAQEISDLNAKGIKVLNRRHIECYLFDDEIIEKLCVSVNHLELLPDCLTMKAAAISNSVNRGNPPDDIKSASGEIYVGLKRILGLTGCGNKTHTFLRDTMAPLVSEDTNVYKLLEQEIFN